MNKLLPILVVAALGVSTYSPVQAQDDDPIATLQIRQGTIMQSTGGEFVNANTGSRLIDGERIMVTEGGKAVVVFDNKCRTEYADPGVYQINSQACGAGYVANSTVATQVALGAVLAPLLIGDPGSNLTPPPPPPVSQ